MSAELAVNPLDGEAKAESSARSSSFYLAMRIMPQVQRQAMFEIYHFCRAVDDIADADCPADDGLERLGKWRADIQKIYQGNPPFHLHKLATAIKQFSLNQEDFIAVIDGMEMDVRGPIYAPDFSTFNLYCDRVACAVGRLSTPIFGLQHDDGLQLSHHLGNALQIINILRDIDEDAAIGRLYLPKELLDEANIKSDNLNEILAHPKLNEVCNQLLMIAARHFESAKQIMLKYERRKVRTPRVMAQAYQAIQAALVKRGFNYPRASVHLNKAKIGLILIRNLIF